MRPLRLPSPQIDRILNLESEGRSATTTALPMPIRLRPGRGEIKSDETLQHPRCVWQIMKRHYAAYTPEMVEQICGPVGRILIALARRRVEVADDPARFPHRPRELRRRP